jgi:hypothetical protein
MVQWWRPYCGVCLAQIADANGGKYPVKEPAAVRENPTKLPTKLDLGRCQTSFDKKDVTFFVAPDKSTQTHRG